MTEYDLMWVYGLSSLHFCAPYGNEQDRCHTAMRSVLNVLKYY